MPWPELGDKNRTPQDAEHFVRSRAAMCDVANDGDGAPAIEMVAMLANCRKGRCRSTCDTIAQGAGDGGTLDQGAQGIRREIWGQFVQLTET